MKNLKKNLILKKENPQKQMTLHKLDSSVPSNALESTEEESVIFRASGGLLQILNQLRDNYGLSRSESIREAIALFFIYKREYVKGNKLAVVDNEGKIISEIT